MTKKTKTKEIQHFVLKLNNNNYNNNVYTLAKMPVYHEIRKKAMERAM